MFKMLKPMYASFIPGCNHARTRARKCSFKIASSTSKSCLHSIIEFKDDLGEDGKTSTMFKKSSPLPTVSSTCNITEHNVIMWQMT